MKRIDADVLIPGRGAPITEGTVLMEDGRFSYAGPADEAPSTPGDVPVTRAAAVMPGLWDCHTHLMGLCPTRNFDLQNAATEPVASRAARAVRDLRAALDAGVTSVREVGGLGVDLAPVVAEGTIDGPAIYGAGAVLSITGGHGDVHALPLPWMHDLSHRQSDFRLCDGVDDCIRATQEQLRRNARIIKVCCSRGVLSERDHPEHQQFSAAELRAIVETAALAGRVVGHCHGKSGIVQALEAGVRTIEHGTFLDEETCAAMRDKGAILVPTRLAMAELSKLSDRLPPWVAGKLAPMIDRHAEAVMMARSYGVTLALGSDVASSSPTRSRWRGVLTAGNWSS